jgi:chemotaxis protein methyltransferase CheR
MAEIFQSEKSEFTEEEIKEIRNIIWKHSGIYVEDSKLYLLKFKTSSRLKKIRVTPREYIFLLNDSSQELKELIESITIGETQFFRDKIQIDTFFDKIFKNYIQEKKNSPDIITILSAGCATGEEPYTLAIYMLEKFPTINFRVFGIDINENFIERAKEGKYSSYSIRGVPPLILTKYFDRIDQETWKIKDIVKKYVSFERVNLMDKLKMRLLGKFDVIFCKNVIIYFDESSRNKVAEHFWYILKKSGYLVLGPAEKIRIVSEIFEPIFESGMFFYKKMEKSRDELI